MRAVSVRPLFFADMPDLKSNAQRRRPPRLPLNGVLLLDKPLGLSSNDALMRAKRLLNAQKAGHTGTLDPLATGLLPLCFGEATKFAQDLLDADKTYLASVKLGGRTTTGDAEGEVLSERQVNVGSADVEAILPRFTGAIDQVPPMYSALKRDGKPLYEYARAGQVLARESRRVTIHQLELIDSQLPDTPMLALRVRCSKGTYVRTLAEDIGEALGCGAHLTGLRRIGVGALSLDGAVTLEDLEALEEGRRAERLAPLDALLQALPSLMLSDDLARRFCHGQRLRLDDTAEPSLSQTAGSAETLIRVYGRLDPERKPALLGVATRSADGLLVPRRLVAQN